MLFPVCSGSISGAQMFFRIPLSMCPIGVLPRFTVRHRTPISVNPRRSLKEVIAERFVAFDGFGHPQFQRLCSPSIIGNVEVVSLDRPARFRRVLQCLANSGFRAATIDEFVSMENDGDKRLPIVCLASTRGYFGLRHFVPLCTWSMAGPLLTKVPFKSVWRRANVSFALVRMPKFPIDNT